MEEKKLLRGLVGILLTLKEVKKADRFSIYNSLLEHLTIDDINSIISTMLKCSYVKQVGEEIEITGYGEAIAKKFESFDKPKE